MTRPPVVVPKEADNSILMLLLQDRDVAGSHLRASDGTVLNERD